VSLSVLAVVLAAVALHRVVLTVGIVLLGLAVPLLPESRRPAALTSLRTLTRLAEGLGRAADPALLAVVAALKHGRTRPGPEP